MAWPQARIVKVDTRKADVLGALQAKCWQAAYKDLLPSAFLRRFTKSSRKIAMRQHMETVEKAEHYFIRVLGVKAGFLVLAPSGDEDAGGAGEVAALYLLPLFWGKGYGGQLLNFAIGRLTALGYPEITLWVLEENHVAKNVYTHYGFVHDGAVRNDSFAGEPRRCLRYRRGRADELPSQRASDIIND